MTPDPGLVRTLYRAAGLPAPDAPADGPLLARFLAVRDEAAFAELVRRHGPMVLGVCRRILGNAPDADDAFQAAFLVLVRRAGGLTGRATVGNFLYGVAVHTAQKARAAAMRRRAKEAAAARHRPTPANPPDWLDVFDAELARLPDKYREPLVLCDLEGLPRRDAAARLGVPDGTLSSRLATAKRLLAERLKRRGVTAPAVALTAAVPASLAEAAVRAAVGRASAAVLTLSHEVMRAMLITKLTAGAAVVLAAAAVGAGAVLARSGDEPVANPPAAVAQAAAKPADPAEPEWMAEFRRVYGLADGQLVKRVPTPFPEFRAAALRHFYPQQRQDGLKLAQWVLNWADGDLKSRSLSVTMPTDHVDLGGVFVFTLDTPRTELVADPKLLETHVTGDYVVRAGTPVEKLLPELERILRTELNLPVRLALRQEDRQVVVVRGRFESRPLAGHEPNHVELSTRPPPDGPNNPYSSGGPDYFFGRLGWLLNRQVVNEAEQLPVQISFRDDNRKPMVVDPSRGIDTRTDNPELADLIRRVEEQTGLTLRFERRTVQVLAIDKDEAKADGPASYPITLSPAEVRECPKLAVEANGLRLDAGPVVLVPIACEPGVTGAVVIGNGTFKYTPAKGEPIAGQFRAAVLRFHPKEWETLVPSTGAKKVTDAGAAELARHVLASVLGHCWQSGGKEAFIPTPGSLAAVLYSKDHGDLLISGDKTGVTVHNFTTGQTLSGGK